MIPEQETTLACSFCGKSQHAVRTLIVEHEPPVCICDECVAAVHKLKESNSPIGAIIKRVVPEVSTQYCGFCGKPHYDAVSDLQLYKGIEGVICNECVSFFCDDVIDDVLDRR